VKAAALYGTRDLRIEDVPKPEPQAGEVLLRVLAFGVCRTDPHILDGELPPLHPHNIPDARDFLAIAAEIKMRPRATRFPLSHAAEALHAIRRDVIDGASVIIPD
jgi:D-arabinose 1-dehydrogenase-like Zn-dependent alcohol dehydrogenase